MLPFKKGAFHVALDSKMPILPIGRLQHLTYPLMCSLGELSIISPFYLLLLNFSLISFIYPFYVKIYMSLAKPFILL